jgi:hypothetical protein
MNILYEDNHLLVVNKPAGQLVQGDQTGRTTLLEEARAWLKEKYNKPGNVFLGLVHRLDRPKLPEKFPRKGTGRTSLNVMNSILAWSLRQAAKKPGWALSV